MCNRVTTSIFFISFAICFTNCKKDVIQNEKSIVISDLISNSLTTNQKPKDGSIVLMHDGAAWVKNNPIDIYASAEFYKNKSKNERILNNAFKIDGNSLSFNGDNRYPGYFTSTGNNPDKDEWLKSLWGRKIKISVSNTIIGSGGEGAEFYVPLPIAMESKFVDNFSINIHSNNTLNWKPDPNNPSQVAYLSIVYEGDFAQQFNSNVPTGTSVKLFLEISDNGSYTLSPEQLSTLPVGGRTTIMLARGNIQMLTDPQTRLETLVTAITYSSSGPIGINP